MTRTLRTASLLLTGLLIGWLLASLAQSLPFDERDNPSATPDKSPTPGKYINRYGERIMRLS